MYSNVVGIYTVCSRPETICDGFFATVSHIVYTRSVTGELTLDFITIFVYRI